jgi:curved DNA-binding protein CbpA
MPDSYDPHEMLGVAIGASEDELRKAFRRKAKSVHPDVSDAPDAADQFARLKASYDLLLERLKDPSAPTPETLYRPAPEVDADQQERILQAYRRRRDAEQRRRNRRRASVKGQARRAERENERFRAEMARRRAALEEEQRQAAAREREVREEAERQQRLEQERQKQAELRQAELERQERLKSERQQRLEGERLEQERQARRQQILAERQRQERLRQEQQERAQREPPISDSPLYCAWKACGATRGLSEPVSTPLGLRRFCKKHYRDYIEFKRDAQRLESPAPGASQQQRAR